MKTYKLLAMWVCLLLIFSQSGCATAGNSSPLQNLKIGMSKDEVRLLAGNPDTIKQATKNNTGKNIESWTYSLKTEEYLLRFKDDNLAWWGEKQDWIMSSDYSGETLQEEEGIRDTTGLEETIND
ncbi:MAG: hypothetical protein NTZ63_03805 [Candidatus Omnitrophica bacterium]|nr:hypothetical protein [Candidatus Omnitrophota bacterium]